MHNHLYQPRHWIASPWTGTMPAAQCAGLPERKTMRSPFTWTSVAATVFAPASMPWFVWALLAAAAFATTATGKILDYRLRRRAIEKVPAQRVVDVLNAGPVPRR